MSHNNNNFNSFNVLLRVKAKTFINNSEAKVNVKIWFMKFIRGSLLIIVSRQINKVLMSTTAMMNFSKKMLMDIYLINSLAYSS